MSSDTVTNAETTVDDGAVVEETRVPEAGSPAPEWPTPPAATKKRPRAPLPPLPAATAIAIWSVTALGLLALWVVLYALALSNVQAHRSQVELYAALRGSLSDATAPTGGVIEPGAPVALVNAPTAGLADTVIVEGTSSGDLMAGPGHLRSSVLPGQPGVSIVYGRATLFGGPFAAVPKLRTGDTITVTTAQGSFTYVVRDLRREGDTIPGLAAGGSRLVLVTAEGQGWRAGWAPDRTVYVDADLKGKPVAAPSGRLSAVPVSEQAMQGDPNALFSLVLWLQALLLVAIGLVWSRVRWGTWQTWVVGVPLVAAAVWGVTSTAVQLLPNLM